MSIKDFFDTMEDSCQPDIEYATFRWSAKGTGFGSFSFYEKEENGEIKLFCDNECMSKEFIKRMLCKMVDDSILTDN